MGSVIDLTFSFEADVYEVSEEVKVEVEDASSEKYQRVPALEIEFLKYEAHEPVFGIKAQDSCTLEWSLFMGDALLRSQKVGVEEWVELQLEALLPNRDHVIRCICTNQLGLQSEEYALDFRTGDNGGRYMQLKLTSEEPIDDPDLDGFACALADYFVLDYARVVSGTGSNCKQNQKTITLSQDRREYSFYFYPSQQPAHDTLPARLRESIPDGQFAGSVFGSRS